MKKPIGTTFKKENIFLATVDCPMEKEKVNTIINNVGCDLSTISKEKNLLGLVTSAFTRKEFDIFYKDEKGYTRFLMDGNETFVGDGSDGKGKLYNIVSAWDYYRDNELCEIENDKGEPAICDVSGKNEDDPLHKYNRDYNLNK